VPRLHLIQVRGTEGPAYLIDPHRPGMLDGVAAQLREHAWIVHAGRIDLQLLDLALGGVPDVVYDTQIAAGLVSTVYPAGLASLLEQRLGLTLDKSETLSDWSKRPLTVEQLGYAAGDVAHLHALWRSLVEDARARTREDAVLAACAEAREQAIADPSVDDAWTHLFGYHRTAPERAVVLAELAAWRESVARETDQPPGAVLANRVLFDLAKRRPCTKRSLVAGRRSPKGTLNRHADAILERIRRAVERPRAYWPQTCPKGSVAEARLAWLTAFALTRGVAEGWAGAIVLPERDRVALAVGPTPDPDAVLSPWRTRLIGPDLRSALDPSAGGLAFPSGS
jgi:ribonuclease D